MLLPERREKIMQILKEKSVVTVHELGKALFISETSIRRDLDYLSNLGLIRKTYGGAMLLKSENNVLSLEARRAELQGAKNLIAEKAVTLISDGITIILDSSSTALAMISLIPRDINLTVVTNGAQAAMELVGKPGIKVYSTGGLLAPNLYSYSGAMAKETLSNIRADIAFLSPKSMILHKGAFCASEEEAAVRQAMIRAASKTVLLCAGQKIGKTASFRMCDVDQVDYIISDILLDEEWKSTFKNAQFI